MEPCPYCGSAVRSGARFCTSCGRRLTPGASESPVGSDIRVGSADNEAAPAAWENALPVAGQAERSAGGGGWLGRSPVASADLWPSATRGPEAAPGADEQPAGENAGADAPSGVGPEQPAVEVAWPSSHWTGWAMPDSVETQKPQASDLDIPPVEIKAADESVEPGQSAGPAEGGEPDAPPAVPAGAVGPFSDAAPVTDDALGRAVGLVDELRGLLPAIAGASGVDVAGAVGAMRAARDESANLDVEALTRAEAAVTAARERPGDVHALLALSGSLDALDSVLRLHGRYVAALDQAIGYLAGGGPEVGGTALTEDEPDETASES